MVVPSFLSREYFAGHVIFIIFDQAEIVASSPAAV